MLFLRRCCVRMVIVRVVWSAHHLDMCTKASMSETTVNASAADSGEGRNDRTGPSRNETEASMLGLKKSDGRLGAQRTMSGAFFKKNSTV